MYLQNKNQYNFFLTSSPNLITDTASTLDLTEAELHLHVQANADENAQIDQKLKK